MLINQIFHLLFFGEFIIIYYYTQLSYKGFNDHLSIAMDGEK